MPIRGYIPSVDSNGKSGIDTASWTATVHIPHPNRGMNRTDSHATFIRLEKVPLPQSMGGIIHSIEKITAQGNCGCLVAFQGGSASWPIVVSIADPVYGVKQQGEQAAQNRQGTIQNKFTTAVPPAPPAVPFNPVPPALQNKPTLPSAVSANKQDTLALDQNKTKANDLTKSLLGENLAKMLNLGQ